MAGLDRACGAGWGRHDAPAGAWVPVEPPGGRQHLVHVCGPEPAPVLREVVECAGPCHGVEQPGCDQGTDSKAVVQSCAVPLKGHGPLSGERALRAASRQPGGQLGQGRRERRLEGVQAAARRRGTANASRTMELSRYGWTGRPPRASAYASVGGQPRGGRTQAAPGPACRACADCARFVSSCAAAFFIAPARPSAAVSRSPFQNGPGAMFRVLVRSR